MLVSSTGPPVIPDAEDVQILLAVKSQFDNAEDVLTDWSNSSTASACTWTAVSCGGPTGGRVVGLNLGNQNLSGKIPPSLGMLPFLQLLNLSTNSLAGQIPPSLGNCTQLAYLNLVANRLQGEIPYFGDPAVTFRELVYMNFGRNRLSGPIPDWLGNVSSLVKLSFHHNKLTGGIPTTISQLSNLQLLYLSLNDLTGPVPPSIANCSALTTLALDMNDLDGPIPSELGQLSNLDNLYLGTNEFTGQVPVAILTNCTELKVLLFENNNLVGGIPPEVGRLQALETLYMRGNKLTGPIPVSFANCSSLSWLSLDDNQLTGDVPWELGRLQSLTSLNLWNNNLTNILPPSLANCTSLNRLTFGRNDGLVADGQSLTPQPFPAWLSSLTDLSYLQLMTVGLEGPIPPSLFNCTQLTTLHMPHNNLTGAIPESLGDLIFLQDIILTGNRLSGRIPESIGNLTWLWNLFLDDNDLEGPLPTGLRDLISLEELQLASNRLSGEIPSAPGFWSHPNLMRITLRDNALAGSIESCFGNLSALAFLDLSFNGLTGPLPSALGSRSPALSRLVLNDNRLGGPVPGDLFAGCAGLASLQLQRNELSGPLPRSVGQLVSLTLLDLSSNGFSGPLPWLGQLSALNLLNLSWNRFSGGLLQDGGTLDLPDKTLVDVDLSHNNFSGSLPSELSTLRGLESLDLSDNLFSGPIPQGLSQLEGLRRFNVSFNELEGPIPTTGVFARINLTDAFLGNPELCGSAVGRNCSAPGAPGCKGLHCRDAVIGVSCAAGALALLALGAWLWVWRRATQTRADHVAYADASIRLAFPRSTKVLTLSAESLKTATEGFSAEYLIGEGAGTRVYKVVVPESGHVFAAKVLHSGRATESLEKHLLEEFQTLGKLRHRNVLRVLGFCSSAELKAAILEYMPNGSLHEHLHGLPPAGGTLSWASRLNIAMGVAHGLLYLHEEFPEPIIHRDLKPMNVLLDDDLEPKICDFGLGKFVFHHEAGEATATALCGTIGYIPPEYTTSTRVSTKGDVYAYGVIVLELLTGRHPTEHSFGEDEDLVTWAQSSANVVDIIDPTIVPHEQKAGLQLQQVTLLLQVALLCCRSMPQSRPTMRDVLGMLLQIKEPNFKPHVNIVVENHPINSPDGVQTPTDSNSTSLS
ncbi:hypothetical protein Mp_2g22920 [Marchantia polymorpha subsp. ruderalis]|uniref:non-specific serine/threonine protein kinase n=1 Tax=Marchantia polymorpha TaxID=3197 RepID=A0A2R6WN65_MARPO|nr:hypothetical protein MARPO_0072s0039 [Marchantia polymorpha]PTQ35293.1 hypothetical protein MARPO_0072s0039 [Marchantia polymorpha]BBN03358.1 hypothetical protein Mp_2g22920 [Marchantia polymorpha subsp. ruderalis]BBN03359.1 hypothetical protein Mp_2g22920 [Marchantia polymorpha subsp. ruderalis]|eukprot:PTQ35292.1 hypothetical protein MARPO_0072s0039 [Marchantia polymorpha]